MYKKVETSLNFLERWASLKENCADSELSVISSWKFSEIYSVLFKIFLSIISSICKTKGGINPPKNYVKWNLLSVKVFATAVAITKQAIASTRPLIPTNASTNISGL